MKLKRLFFVALVLAVVLCSAFIVSCSDDDNGNDNENTNVNTNVNVNDGTPADFKVTVLDDNGNPLKSVVVYFGEEMTITNADGTATINLPKQKYDIKVFAMDQTEYFVGENVYVDGGKTEITVNVCKRASELPYHSVNDNGTPEDSSDDRKAYTVTETGTYYTTGVNGDRVYFLFLPQKDGIYEFGMNVEGSVGYFGAPINAYYEPIEPYEENGVVKIEIKKINLGEVTGGTPTPYLIGVEAESEIESLLFSIKRVGDPEYTIQDLPYTNITNPYSPEPLYLGYKNWSVILTDVNISSASTVKAVYNEEDGYYHLNDENGPIIYVKVSKESKYLPSFYDICQPSHMSAYIYDENGEFVDKESYNTLIYQYNEIADKTYGIYPLDSYMARAIKNHGNQAGWWDPSSPNCLFGAESFNDELAWLFACCTIEIDKNANGATSEAPISVEKSPSTGTVEEKLFVMTNGEATYLKLATKLDSTLKVTDKDGELKVIYNGQEYTATNGTIKVELKKDVLDFQIVYIGESNEEAVEVTLSIV